MTSDLILKIICKASQDVEHDIHTINTFIIQACVHACKCIHPASQPCIPSFIHSFVCLLVGLLVCSFACSLACSLVHSFIHTFIHNYILSYATINNRHVPVFIKHQSMETGEANGKGRDWIPSFCQLVPCIKVKSNFAF